VDLVIAPALGGVIVGHEVARSLGVRALFSERQDGTMSLRRGFSIEPGERCVVVEDVITTGGSTREVMDLVNAHGGVVVAAVGSLIDRSGGAVDLGVPRHAAGCSGCAGAIASRVSVVPGRLTRHKTGQSDPVSGNSPDCSLCRHRDPRPISCCSASSSNVASLTSTITLMISAGEWKWRFVKV
jgi:hypothetical protein